MYRSQVEDLPLSVRDAVRDSTCTVRAVVESIHCTTERAVKIFFCPFPSLFHPLCHTPFPRPKLFFSPLKKNRKENPCQNNLKTRRGKPRNVLVRRGEGYQTGAALARGLPYSSRRHGDQRSLEKYAHGRESQAEG